MDPKPLIEAILFSATRPLSRSHILRRLRFMEREKVEAALDRLIDEYRMPDKGMEVVEISGGYVMRTKPQYAGPIKALKKKKGNPFSRPMIEVLAIVAYKQPITKREIDELRGVDSKRPIRELLERNLIRIEGRKDGEMLFGTTDRFLFMYGLKDLMDLPAISELDNL